MAYPITMALPSSSSSWPSLMALKTACDQLPGSTVSSVSVRAYLAKPKIKDGNDLILRQLLGPIVLKTANAQSSNLPLPFSG